MLSFILLFDIYAGWIMKNYLHVTLYCFNDNLINELIKSDSELTKKLDDYFSFNYAKNINNIDTRDVILLITDELYSENQDSFIVIM